MSLRICIIESIAFISLPLMFFFTTMEMAKITEYNLLDCVIRFGGVKKSTIFFGSLWFAGAEAYIRESISNRGEIMSELSFSHLFFLLLLIHSREQPAKVCNVVTKTSDTNELELSSRSEWEGN